MLFRSILDLLTVSFYALSYSTAELVERLVDGRNFRHPFSILLNHVISKTNFTKCIDVVCTYYFIERHVATAM